MRDLPGDMDSKNTSTDPKDPGLRIERLQVRNFRRISALDVTIPPSAKIICLVGPNGSGKSALMSVLAHSLFSLTHETVPDGEKQNQGADDLVVFRRSLSLAEIGPVQSFLALVADWRHRGGPLRYSMSWSRDSTEATKATFAELGIQAPPTEPRTAWNPKPPRADDPVAASVVLDRPASRFEIPYYEETSELLLSPRVATKWDRNRLLPFRRVRGGVELERFLLDVVLDLSLQNNDNKEFLRQCVDTILQALRLFHPYEQLTIMGWPYRRASAGTLSAMSLLSAGELDIIATVISILEQQLYVRRKFGWTTAHPPSGIVFIDEFESHLHPQAQQQLLPYLLTAFPSIQFVISTHSPFVIRSLPRSETLVLRLPDGEVLASDWEASSIEEIVNLVFAAAGSWTKETLALLKKLEDLLSEPGDESVLKNVYLELMSRDAVALRSAVDKLLALNASADVRDRLQLHLNEFSKK